MKVFLVHNSHTYFRKRILPEIAQKIKDAGHEIHHEWFKYMEDDDMEWSPKSIEGISIKMIESIKTADVCVGYFNDDGPFALNHMVMGSCLTTGKPFIAVRDANYWNSVEDPGRAYDTWYLHHPDIIQVTSDEEMIEELNKINGEIEDFGDPIFTGNGDNSKSTSKRVIAVDEDENVILPFIYGVYVDPTGLYDPPKQMSYWIR